MHAAGDEIGPVLVVFLQVQVGLQKRLQNLIAFFLELSLAQVVSCFGRGAIARDHVLCKNAQHRFIHRLE